MLKKVIRLLYFSRFWPCLDYAVGVLSIHVSEAKGLKNVEVTGKSDPYVKIVLGGTEVARTKAIDNKFVSFLPLDSLIN